MAGKRGRRTRYTWFPTNYSDAEDTTQRVPGIQFSLAVNRNGAITTGIVPLTADAPREPGDINPETDVGVLNTIVGNEYFLRRIVGKMYITHELFGPGADGLPTDPSNWPLAALCTAGIFVARAGDASAAEVDLPIGATVAANLRESYSPSHVNTIREPWIWRRAWILGNPAVKYFLQRGAFPTINEGEFFEFPTNNAEYGSVADGPHVDAKTMRRVRDDERLFFAFSTVRWPLGDAALNDSAIRGHFDYRILAQVRKARSRGVF